MGNQIRLLDVHYTFNISLINSEFILNLDPENVEERAPGKLSLLDRAIAIADDFYRIFSEGKYLEYRNHFQVWRTSIQILGKEKFELQ